MIVDVLVYIFRKKNCFFFLQRIDRKHTAQLFNLKLIERRCIVDLPIKRRTGNPNSFSNKADLQAAFCDNITQQLRVGQALSPLSVNDFL